VGREDSESQGGARSDEEAANGKTSGVPIQANPQQLDLPVQSPLYHAEQSDRYQRQALILDYERQFDCRLVAVVDQIFGWSVTFFEELIYDANPNQDLHLLLDTPGGDGEIAVRLARAAQTRCRELTVVVPDKAKSAGTVLALGAHRIIMGPTSDLGPVDPQFQIGDNTLASAKDIIAAVDDAVVKVQTSPETYPLFASLLSDLTGLMYQQAKRALEHTDDLLRAAITSNPDRSPEVIEEMCNRLHGPLIQDPQIHGAVFGGTEALSTGLPIELIDPSSDQWQLIWRLWTKYFSILPARIYEGSRASKIIRFAG